MARTEQARVYQITPWQQAAACRNYPVDWFYPIAGGGTKIEALVDRAITICRQCPVQSECKAYADANDEVFGIWGGVWREKRRKRW